MIAGPSGEVDMLNKAIGATPAIVMECKDMVRQYLPTILRLLEVKTDHGVCREIHMCAPSSDSSNTRKLLMADQCAS